MFSSGNIQMLLTLLIVVVIVVTFIKYSIKLAISIIAILFIFQLGFMMTGTDLNEVFNLDSHLEESKSGLIIDFFDDFRRRGDELGIVNTDAVYDSMVSGFEQGGKFLINTISEIDVIEFSSLLAENIYEAGEEMVEKEELTEIINEMFENIPKEEAEELAEQTYQELLELRKEQ